MHYRYRGPLWLPYLQYRHAYHRNNDRVTIRNHNDPLCGRMPNLKWILLGIDLVEKGRVESRSLLRRALSLNPQYPIPSLLLGLSLSISIALYLVALIHLMPSRQHVLHYARPCDRVAPVHTSPLAPINLTGNKGITERY